MTKQDYKLIATSLRLRKGWPIAGLDPEQVRVSIAKSIAAELGANNPRFNPAKFFEACEVNIAPKT